MPADNKKFYKYNVEGEYFDEDSGIIKEIIYYPDTKEITFTFLDDSQKTVELANLVANTELSTLLARYITSDTLDITGTEESTNIEVPESYKNCYIVTRNDVTDITLLYNNTYSVTLSEELEQVITGFKQNLYVDWVTEFPELSNILGIIKLTNCYPSKKIYGSEELPTYYIFSATDGLNDFSMSFFYEDDTWNVIIAHDNLADKEWVNMQISMAVAEKSTVIPNPELSGDEPDLEGAEIDGVKYKVGGGKLYQHSIKMIGTGATAGDRLVILNMLSYSNQPKTWNNVKTYCTNLQQATGWLSAGGENYSIHSIQTQENSNRLFVYYGSDSAYAFMPEPTSLTDTITEVE